MIPESVSIAFQTAKKLCRSAIWDAFLTYEERFSRTLENQS
jgi:hypothetical protein